jgi:hypothetical protein
MTFDPTKIKQKYTPHNTLEEGWTYISIPEDDIIIGVRVAVTKVMKAFNPDGSPATDPTGSPIFSFQSTNIVRTLTRGEYEVEKKRGIPK